MSRHAVHLRAFVVEGWRALARARSAWALAAGALILSVVAVIAEIPLREPGRFSLNTLALVDQLLVLLLVAVQVMAVRPASPCPWWPCAAETAVLGRAIGMLSLCACLLATVVGFQYLLVAATGDLEARAFTQQVGERLDGHYLVLWAGLGTYAAVLLAWGTTLRILLNPALTLLTLMVLVFSGYALPRLGHESVALAPIIAVLPDLGALAPVELAQHRDWNARAVAYGLTHAAMVWLLGAVALRVLWERGRSVDSAQSPA